jgi:DNA-binding GntR family transcriptional regulator
MASQTITPDLVQRAAGISEQVTTTLRNLILSGQIDEDEVLTEAGLGSRLGVSRTPVREALARLENEGLIESAGLRGKRIKRFSAAEISELFWLRRTIEEATVAELAERGLNPDDLKTLADYLEAQRQAAEADNPAEFLEIDHHFHAALVQFLGYERVAVMLQGLRYTFDLIGLKPTYQHAGRTGEVLSEHRAILAALAARDAKAAKRAMAEHLARTKALVLASLTDD